MTGIAAGVKDSKASIGDILVPDISYDYGSGKYSSNDSGETLFLNEPQQFRLSAEVKANLEQLQNDSEFLNNLRVEAFKKNLCKNIPETLKIHIGAIGSGSAVISDEKLINEKRETQTRRLIGIEMEIYGLFAATHNSTLPTPTPIVMKSICDWGDNKKNKEFQEYASFTSAQTLLEYVKRHLDN
jgi:nucleoside phosphorylase